MGKETAVERLETFLAVAYRDKWIRENFMLKNINSQKDKFFFQKDLKNGQQATSTEVFTREGVSAEFSRRNYNRQ